MDRQWDLSATSGMMGSDIDIDFIKSLSNAELLYFRDEVDSVKYLVDDECAERILNGK